MLFGEHSGGKIEVVEDPYYGGKEGFEIAYEQCMRFSMVSAVYPFSAKCIFANFKHFKELPEGYLP